MAELTYSKLSDDDLEQVSGGVTYHDPYGYICEATVISSKGTDVANGVERSVYEVEADNGNKYLASWSYRSVLESGTRVQLHHANDGYYNLEPIVG